MLNPSYESWGRYPRPIRQKVITAPWPPKTGAALPGSAPFLPFGRGRSYGDSCLNEGGTLVDTRPMDHILEFDRTSGIIRVEAGATLAELIPIILAAGWFFPVVPGTQFVTIGGAIANDIHGKNHHRSGTFGCHVRQFALHRSDGRMLICSEQSNREFFSATIGGLGLTGLIVWAELQLKKVVGPLMEIEAIRFGSLNEFEQLSQTSDRDYEYDVAWLDVLGRGNRFGRGVFFRGNHSDMQAPPNQPTRTISFIPSRFPGFVLNRWTMKLFNEVHFQYFSRRASNRTGPLIPFFFPLDRVAHWNRLYGKNGFLQYQCVCPTMEAIREILLEVSHEQSASFLSVLKKFGARASPGLLSFPRAGYTLCLDFKFQGDHTLQLLQRLDDLVMNAGGAVYPAKDARMSVRAFKSFFPQWEKFAKGKDQQFSSSFWRRVTQDL